jgi:short subunit fatty acids transporter
VRQGSLLSAQQLGIDLAQSPHGSPKRTRPGEWLEYSPLPTLFIAALGLGWLAHEFSAKGAVAAISNLNTYNLIFVLTGLLLHLRPVRGQFSTGALAVLAARHDAHVSRSGNSSLSISPAAHV